MRTYTNPQLLRVLRGSFDSRYVVDVFYDGVRRLADVPAIDVQQNEDGTAKVQQSGSLTIIWQDRLGRSIAPRTMDDLLSPYGTVITLHMLITAGPMFTERVTIGTYVVSDTPDVSTTRWRFGGQALSKGDRIKLTFKDPFYKILRNRFDQPTVTPPNSTVYGEIQRLTRLAITRSASVPDMNIPRALVYEEDRLNAVYELANVRDAIPYMTADGTLSLRPKAWGQPVDTITADDAGLEPVQEVAATYTAWTEQRRNLFTNPRSVSTGTGYGSGTLGTQSSVTDMLGDIPTAQRWTRTGLGLARTHDLTVGAAMPGAGSQVRVRARLRASEAMTVQLLARPAIASATNQVVLGTGSIPAGVTDIDLVGTSFTAAVTSTSGVTFTSSSGANGATLDVTAVDICLAPGGDRFDGWTPGSLLVRHRFVGFEHRSASVRETRQVVAPTRKVPLPPARGTLLGVSRGMSAEGVYNRVVIRSQGQDAAVLATAEITDGTLRAQNNDGSDSPFGRVPYFMSSQLVTTPGAARDVAALNLPRVARPQAVVVTVEEIVNPLREVGDVVRILRAGESFLGRVQSISRSSAKTQKTSVVMADAT